MPLFNLTNKPSAGVKNYTVHIDDTDETVPANPITLGPGPHKLHWWFAGNPNETLDITLTPAGGGPALLDISDSIAPGFGVEAGDKAFMA